MNYEPDNQVKRNWDINVWLGSMTEAEMVEIYDAIDDLVYTRWDHPNDEKSCQIEWLLSATIDTEVYDESPE